MFAIVLLGMLVLVESERTDVDTLVNLCGNLKQDRICDPDELFSNEELTTLKQALEFMSADTVCQSELKQCQNKMKGCDMYIVINNGMLTNFKDNHLLAEAQRYATELLKQLIENGCRNAFLLYYSHQDHVFYVVTEEHVTQKLPSHLIGEIALINKKELYSNLSGGFLNIIHDLRLALNDQYVQKVFFSEPKHEAQLYSPVQVDGASRVQWSACSLVTLCWMTFVGFPNLMNLVYNFCI